VILPAHDILSRLRAGDSLSQSQAEAAFEHILTGQFDDAQIGAFLALIAARPPGADNPGGGPTVDELVGGARVMRRYVTPVATTTPRMDQPASTLIDTCGTGGAPKTFNVSTVVAFVVASARPPNRRRVAVAKHGSTSRTGRGSAEVLQALGVNIAASPEVQSRCLGDLGVCFSFSVHHHPAMKHAAAPRKSLGFPTIFNLLGPLTNPAGAKRQLIGTFSHDLAKKLALTMTRLDTEAAMVVHSYDGLDELSTTGPNTCHRIRGAAIETTIIDPAELGLARAELVQLQAGSLDKAVSLFHSVLAGAPSPARDMVLLNAAGALIVADAALGFDEGLELAREAIDSGRARLLLDELVRQSHIS
jgi:anthranilate phosphoribosyltransferase